MEKEVINFICNQNKSVSEISKKIKNVYRRCLQTPS